MRRLIYFLCDGASLAATADDGDATTGLLIASGGNEIRVGAHRGMARLASAIAERGYPVFRFDRRGIGDSDGENRGFRSSAPDLAAALATFRSIYPRMKAVVGFGNCDAATALVLHDSSVDARVLANPWLIEPVDRLPPPAAIKDRYARRIRDPGTWAALLTGKIEFRAAAKGLGRIATASKAPPSLAAAFAANLSRCPTTIVLAERDNTAIAFADLWKGASFAAVRATIPLVTLDSASHSFASDEDFAALTETLLSALASASCG